MKQTSASEPLSPAILGEFADMLHERRSQLAPPLTRNSRSMSDLWTILHEREVARIDQALERIRMGSYGTCGGCGSQIQYLQLFLEPASDRCLNCRPKGRSAHIA